MRWAAVLFSVTLALGAAACGEKKEGDQTAKPKDGFEASWTGYLAKTYECDLELCGGAAKSALQTLHLRLVEESAGIFKKTLVAETGDGTSIAVRVAEVTKTTTRVSVKVGSLLGDQDAARRIHSEIEAEMKAGRQSGHKWRGFSGFGAWVKPTPTGPPSGG